MSRALVIVDIQRDYVPGGKMPLHEPEAAAQKAAQVLAAFRASGDPVIHVQHLSPAGGGFLEEGTEGAEVVLEPGEGARWTRGTCTRRSWPLSASSAPP